MRVRRGAAAEQYQPVIARPELVPLTGRDHHAITVAHVELVFAQAHAAAPAREVVDLLRHTVVVLDRLAARRYGGLCERLVAGIPGRDPGKFTDFRPVGRDESFTFLDSHDVHPDK